jgi:hypothetical protein
VARKKSEDASAKVPGKQHVTHANSNPPDEPVWIRKGSQLYR